MSVVGVSDEMLAALRERTKPQLDAFFEKVPSAKEPIMAYLKEMNR